MLFMPFSLGRIQLKNRIVMPPMCMYKADESGMATEWHRLHYATRAMGQVGLIIVEATAVEPRGRISDTDLGLWNDQQIAGLRQIVDSVHEVQGKIAVQLAHAGRKSQSKSGDPVAPSGIAFSPEYRVPAELTKTDIASIVQEFASAAGRAVKAGFDAIELHGAHGYLIHEFLSPLTNKRTDEYGGTQENRVRLLDEILTAVRGMIPKDFPIIVRVSAEEYQQGGNTPECVAALLNRVKRHGIDLVNVSSGGVVDTAPRAYAGYQIHMALAIKAKTGLAVLGGGLITEPVQAKQVLKAGIDVVYLGRELLRNPYWPLHAAHVLQKDIEWPEPYLRGKWDILR
jgi:NADPH2 dehydrogenase